MASLPQSYEDALRVLGLKPGVALSRDEVEAKMKQNALKLATSPKVSDAYKVLLKYSDEAATPEKKKRLPKSNWSIVIPKDVEPSPTKRPRTSDPSLNVSEVEKKVLAQQFISLDKELSRLGAIDRASDMELKKDDRFNDFDNTNEYQTSALLESVRSRVEKDTRVKLSLDSVACMLALANGMISARWVWVQEKQASDLMLKQNRQEAVSGLARKEKFVKAYAMAMERDSIPRVEIPPQPSSEYEVTRLTLSSLFTSVDKLLVENALLRHPAVMFDNAASIVRTRTDQELSLAALSHIVALAPDMIEARWVWGKTDTAKLEIRRLGSETKVPSMDKTELGQRLAKFNAALESTTSTEKIPSQDLSEPPARPKPGFY